MAQQTDVFCLDDSVPCVFKIHPPEATDGDVRVWIELSGGVVLNNDEKDPCQITIIDYNWYASNERDLPRRSELSKGYDYFKPLFIRHCREREELVDLEKYRYGRSIFKRYHANDVMRRRMAWKDLQLKPSAVAVNGLAKLNGSGPSSVSNKLTVSSISAGPSTKEGSRERKSMSPLRVSRREDKTGVVRSSVPKDTEIPEIMLSDDEEEPAGQKTKFHRPNPPTPYPRSKNSESAQPATRKVPRTLFRPAESSLSEDEDLNPSKDSKTPAAVEPKSQKTTDSNNIFSSSKKSSSPLRLSRGGRKRILEDESSEEEPESALPAKQPTTRKVPRTLFRPAESEESLLSEDEDVNPSKGSKTPAAVESKSKKKTDSNNIFSSSKKCSSPLRLSQGGRNRIFEDESSAEEPESALPAKQPTTRKVPRTLFRAAESEESSLSEGEDLNASRGCKKPAAVESKSPKKMDSNNISSSSKKTSSPLRLSQGGRNRIFEDDSSEEESEQPPHGKSKSPATKGELPAKVAAASLRNSKRRSSESLFEQSDDEEVVEPKTRKRMRSIADGENSDDKDFKASSPSPSESDSANSVETVKLMKLVKWNPPMKDKAPKKQSYSYAEGQTLLDYITANGLHYNVGGNAIWTKMEKQKILKNRTSQSMKEHFRKKVFPNIQEYKCSKDDLKKFKLGEEERNRGRKRGIRT